MQDIRPSVAVKALYMWHFSSKVTFNGTSQFTGLSNLCSLSSFPSFLNSPSSRRNHGLHSMDLGETVKMKRKHLCNFCSLHEYTSTRRKSHLNEVYTKHFTISLSISLFITQSMSKELLRVFSSAWEKKHVSVLHQWMYNMHITDLRKINIISLWSRISCSQRPPDICKYRRE